MIVPLTSELVTAFYGKPLGKSIRGYAYVVDGEPLSVFGLHYDVQNKRWLLYCDAKPEARAGLHTVTGRRRVVIAMRKMLQILEHTKGTIHVTPERGIHGAVELLERMGFTRITDDVYGWAQWDR